MFFPLSSFVLSFFLNPSYQSHFNIQGERFEHEQLNNEYSVVEADVSIEYSVISFLTGESHAYCTHTHTHTLSLSFSLSLTHTPVLEKVRMRCESIRSLASSAAFSSAASFSHILKKEVSLILAGKTMYAGF